MAKPQSTSHHKKALKVRDELIYDTIMAMVLAAPDRAVKPEAIARALRNDEWQGLLKRIRLFVGKLAKEGYIDILRKGDVADPDDFKGVYKITSAENAPHYTPRMPPDQQPTR